MDDRSRNAARGRVGRGADRFSVDLEDLAAGEVDAPRLPGESDTAYELRVREAALEIRNGLLQVLNGWSKLYGFRPARFIDKD